MSLKVCQASTWWGSHWELRGAIRSTSASTIKHFEKSYMIFRKKKKKATVKIYWKCCLIVVPQARAVAVAARRVSMALLLVYNLSRPILSVKQKVFGTVQARTVATVCP